MITISHNFQTRKVQEISDVITGTTGIIRNAAHYKGKQIIFNGVLYMAEDLYIMSEGEAEIYIPQIKIKNNEIISPRCPMIKYQGLSRIVNPSQIDEARKTDPDKVLVYINTCVY